MTTKTFSLFTGIVMAIVIAITTFLNKIFKGYVTVPGRLLLVGLLAAVLDAVLAFCIAYEEKEDEFTMFWLLCLLFLVSGIISIWQTDRCFHREEDEKEVTLKGAQVIYSTAILLLAAALFTAAIHFFGDKNFLYYPELCSSLAFLIPLLCWYTYCAERAIPLPEYRLWGYPPTPIAVPEDNYNEKLLVIGFLLNKKTKDKNKTFFRAKTPESIRLGELFYHFINDYNELQNETPIEYLDENEEPITWWFRLKGKWFQPDRILDHSMSVRENKIKENAIIICEQVDKTVQ